MPPRRRWSNIGPAQGLLTALAGLSLVVEIALVVLLRRMHPSNPGSIAVAALVGCALLANFVAGVVAVRRGMSGRRDEALLAADLARQMLGSSDLRSAMDRASQCLREAFGLAFVSLEPDEVAGDENRSAIALRDGDAVIATLLVPGNLPTAVQQRLRQRVVPTLETLLAAAHDRERMNAALAESRQERQRFFDMSSDLLAISDPKRLIRVNPAFEKTLGYTLDELNAAAFDLPVPQDQDQLKEMIANLSRGRAVRFENRLVSRDGSHRWIEWNIAPHGPLFYSVGRDVTERRIEQDALRQTQVELEDSRDELSDLAAQQAALRRVATLVARGARPEEVFKAVADEMGRCLKIGGAAISRYDGDAMTMLALADVPADFPLPIGEPAALEGDNVLTRVLRSGRAARMAAREQTGKNADDMRALGVQWVTAVPIVVGGRLWGVATAGSTDPQPLPADIEERIADFTELAATSIANAVARSELQDSRDHLRVLATQQAALRRVATLVAQAVNPSEVFAAIAEEMARCLNVGSAAVLEYESDNAATVVASYAEPGEPSIPTGERVTLEGDNVSAMVLRSGRPARMDTFEGAAGPLAARLRAIGMVSRVGAPIVVDERLWGVAIVGSSRTEPLPPDTEDRIAEFAELAATAIAASTARADLIASRARIVAAADDARRRIERDLHDGAQQRLVSLGLKLRMAEASLPTGLDELKAQMNDAVAGVNEIAQELQEISRGIHPAILSSGGLGPALKALGRRSTVPASLDIAIARRLPEQVEITAYYVVAEALANAAKHAQAAEVRVHAEATESTLRLTICDDGIGGADPKKGSGLMGLKDRTEVIGGRLQMVSIPDRGTSIDVTIPLDS
jgi:PAS domain S-box-containing protein